MFRKTVKTVQFNIFTSPVTLSSGNALKFYEDKTAWHSNQLFCKDNQMNLYLHTIQVTKGRYQFIVMENGEHAIFDTKTNRLIEPYKSICKNGIPKWRIETENGYRYFTQKEVDTYQIRRKIAGTPVKTLQFRNNVEATIFQLGYPYSNDKSRYQGLIKHQMWANIRCLWVNFVRILKYITQICQRTTISAKYTLKTLVSELHFAFNSFVAAILPLSLLVIRKYSFLIQLRN